MLVNFEYSKRVAACIRLVICITRPNHLHIRAFHTHSPYSLSRPTCCSLQMGSHPWKLVSDTEYNFLKEFLSINLFFSELRDVNWCKRNCEIKRCKLAIVRLKSCNYLFKCFILWQRQFSKLARSSFNGKCVILTSSHNKHLLYRPRLQIFH